MEINCKKCSERFLPKKPKHGPTPQRCPKCTPVHLRMDECHPCAECGQPTNRGPFASFCAPCRKTRSLAQQRIARKKYFQTPKGIAERKKQKHLWWARGAAKRAIAKKKRAVKKIVVICKTLLCKRAFIVDYAHQGGREFCNLCRREASQVSHSMWRRKNLAVVREKGRVRQRLRRAGVPAEERSRIMAAYQPMAKPGTK